MPADQTDITTAGQARGARRILSLWFPRLGAERWLRLMRGTASAPTSTQTASQ